MSEKSANLVKLSRENLLRYRELSIDYDAAKGTMHLEPRAYVRAAHAYWEFWDELAGKYSLPETDALVVGFRTGVMYKDAGSALVPLRQEAPETQRKEGDANGG